MSNPLFGSASVAHNAFASLIILYWVSEALRLSLTVLTVPVAAALLYRIRVEESVLRAGLGPAYLAYMARTKRLIPGLY